MNSSIEHARKCFAGSARLIAVFALAVLAADSAAAANDFPTVTVADYVFGCMKANGETRDVMEKCACSVDVIASLLPYERYIEAETFLSMGQVSGEKGVIFRTTEESKAAIGDLRRAQAEAEIRCFY